MKQPKQQKLRKIPTDWLDPQDCKTESYADTPQSVDSFHRSDSSATRSDASSVHWETIIGLTPRCSEDNLYTSETKGSHNKSGGPSTIRPSSSRRSSKFASSSSNPTFSHHQSIYNTGRPHTQLPKKPCTPSHEHAKSRVSPATNDQGHVQQQKQNIQHRWQTTNSNPFQDREEEDSTLSCVDFLFEKTTFDDIAMGCYLYPSGRAYEDKNRAMGVLVSRVISYLCMLGLMFVITYELSSSTSTSIVLSTSQIVLSLASVVVCLILTTCSAVFTYQHFTSVKDSHLMPTAHVAWAIVGVLAHATWVFSHVDLITYMVFYVFPSLAPSSLSPVPLFSLIAILRYVMAVSAWVEIQQALIPMRFTYTFYVTCAYSICHVVYHLLIHPNTTWTMPEGNTINAFNDKRWALHSALMRGVLVFVVSLIQIVCHGVMVRIAHARASEDEDTVDGDWDFSDSFDEEFGGGGSDMTAHGRQVESQLDPRHGASLHQSAVVCLD